MLATSFAAGQSVTQENLGAITAAKMADGLGWSVSSLNEAEFAAAAAAGATHVRLDNCEWYQVEGQSLPPNNVSTGYSLPSGCVSGLTYAKRYGLRPTVIASYGSPYHQILTLTVNKAEAIGGTTVSVDFQAGVGGKTLSSLVYPFDYLANPSGVSITNSYSYDGALITGVSLSGPNSAVLTLASSLTANLPVGFKLYANEILYPSPETGNPSDPSTVAYANYARYLATQIEALGMTGEVELWNEPTWGDDCWDNRRNCYDHDPGFTNELQAYGPNYGFAAAVQGLQPVQNVTYVWAGTNKSGSADLLGPRMKTYSGVTFNQNPALIASESLHPYGSNPEDDIWNEPCLQANPSAGQLCNTVPTSTSNFVLTEANNIINNTSQGKTGINHSITETGASTLYMPTDHQARFAMRQYLGYMAANVSYVEFYRMYDTTAPGQTGFGYITLTNNNTSYTPQQNYTALAGFMGDIATFQAQPVSNYTSSSLPSVTSYKGTYNLDHLAIVGARKGDTSNSIAYVLWQRSYSPIMCQLNVTVACWGSLPQPPAADTTVSIPSGEQVSQVINLVTRAYVPYSQTGSSVVIPVSDDPIELMLVPSGNSNITPSTPKLIFENIAAQTQGNSFNAVATSPSAGIITYSVISGPATVSGSTVTATGPGSVTLQASQAAKGNYTSANATTSFQVTATTPAISFQTIPTRTYGDIVTVNASSASKGAIAFSIVSGPATISGSTITTTGKGTVVVKASQEAYGAYISATATTSFNVLPKTPILNFPTIPTHTYGDVLTVNASSASDGFITYSIMSGPATVSGTTLTTTAVGMVWVEASQAASGNYTAATNTASFHVIAANPNLVFTPVPNQPFNTSFTVAAKSQSSNQVVYSVVSGPARYIGSTITTQNTAGTVVLQAVQYGGGNWNQVSATTTFTVSATVTPTLSFLPITAHKVQDVFTVSASSASNGPITYTVASGPATISGSTVIATGAGTVVLSARQAAAGSYGPAATTTTFAVSAPPVLTFATIPIQATGSPFTLVATSPSPGPVTYSVVSGPAIILVGSSCEALGTGTVTVSAYQAASGVYPGMSAQASFQANGSLPTTLAFAGISPKVYGDTFNVHCDVKFFWGHYILPDERSGDTCGSHGNDYRYNRHNHAQGKPGSLRHISGCNHNCDLPHLGACSNSYAYPYLAATPRKCVLRGRRVHV